MKKKEVRLLVVQESQDFRLMLEDWIELHSLDYDISVRTTESGQDGYEILHNWCPSVVLVDAHIPDLDSFSLVSQCTRSCVPVFVTSAEQSMEIELTALQSGAAGYFPAMEDPGLMDQLLADIVEASDYSLEMH